MRISTFSVVFLLISLLTQQVSAAVMSASMPVNMNSSTSSEMNSGEMVMDMSHHQMDHGMSQVDAMDMKNMDCCQNDCANCLASCQYVIPGFALQFSFVISKEAIQLSSSEPLVHSPTSPFRPPIAA